MNKTVGKAGLATVVVSATIFTISGVSGSVASTQIGSAGIKNESLTTVDIKNGSLRVADLRPEAVAGLMKGKVGPAGPAGPQGPAGPPGPASPAGPSGLAEAYYAVAYYDEGDTNAGAIATVACKAESHTAISGGAQVLGLDAGANSRNTPISSSFPGRMDWDLGTPKATRLDGWIVQFGGNAGATADKAPEKVKVWALCVPSTTIPVEVTYTQSED